LIGNESFVTVMYFNQILRQKINGREKRRQERQRRTG
jgi:hypothetical protein